MAPRKPKSAAPQSACWGGLAEGATVLVDTAPFIYLLEDHPVFLPRFLGLFEASERGEVRLALSVITLAEILTGPHKAGLPDLAKRYETVLASRHSVVPVTAPIAGLAAQLRARYRLKLPDALQLATALDIGAAALVTHDRDFAEVQGIPVLTGGE
ncbi:MAG: tRNA(fMet)-specific endonuclease VapC [Pseudomonadota bacterium]